MLRHIVQTSPAGPGRIVADAALDLARDSWREAYTNKTSRQQLRLVSRVMIEGENVRQGCLTKLKHFDAIRAWRSRRLACKLRNTRIGSLYFGLR